MCIPIRRGVNIDTALLLCSGSFEDEYCHPADIDLITVFEPLTSLALEISPIQFCAIAAVGIFNIITATCKAFS